MPYLFYSVRCGRRPGIFNNWGQCQAQVSGVQGAKFKGFNTKEEAELFLTQDGGPKVIGLWTQSNYNTPPIPTQRGWGQAAPQSWGQPSQYPQPTQPYPQPTQPYPQSTQPYPQSTQSWEQFSQQPPQPWGQPAQPPQPWGQPAQPSPQPQLDPNVLQIWTDGSCRNSIGGWSYVVVLNNEVVTTKDGPVQPGPNNENPTNNRAEMIAIIEALKSSEVTSGKPVVILTDSELCFKTLTMWAKKWSQNNWRKFDGKPIQNPDLVSEAFMLFTNSSNVHIKHVPGHAGLKWNEMADTLAKKYTMGNAAPGTVSDSITPEINGTPVVNITNSTPAPVAFDEGPPDLFDDIPDDAW